MNATQAAGQVVAQGIGSYADMKQKEAGKVSGNLLVGALGWLVGGAQARLRLRM